MACEVGARGERPPGSIRLGTWNMSHWTAAKARAAIGETGVDVLAVQETHLAVMPLQWAHRSVREVGVRLHHGHPVPPQPGQEFGRSCGVGFLAAPGVALMPVLPCGAAWRRLHALGRLHGVRLAPRLGLPNGILLLSVYVPLQVKRCEVERARFVEAMIQVTTALDMQVPTLLLGDFNGSLYPSRDFRSESGQRRPACPLLVHLLGPGAPWVDVHVAMLEVLPWTFQSESSEGQLAVAALIWCWQIMQLWHWCAQLGW